VFPSLSSGESGNKACIGIQFSSKVLRVFQGHFPTAGIQIDRGTMPFI